MTQYSGETGDGLAAARAALTARDHALGEADQALAGVLGAAHRLAVESIRRIENVQSQIESLGAEPIAAAGPSARLILDRQRELIDILTAARDGAAVKSTELQRLRAAYIAVTP